MFTYLNVYSKKGPLHTVAVNSRDIVKKSLRRQILDEHVEDQECSNIAVFQDCINSKSLYLEETVTKTLRRNTATI